MSEYVCVNVSLGNRTFLKCQRPHFIAILRFRDTSASSAAICFFRGYLLLLWLFVSSAAICFFRDVLLYLLGETCETWTLLGLSITDIKFVLTRKDFDIFCQKFHIPEDVHPQLPSPNHTIHGMPVGKIASFPWHTEKNVSREPFSKSTEFNADDYAILVARMAPFWKFPEPFLYLIRMSRNYTLDEDTYPTFLHDDGTGGYLPTRIVLLLPVAPTRAESELKASVKRLFDEGGSADQLDSAVGGGQEAEVGIATGVRIVVEENVAAERPRCPQKKRKAITNAGGSSHPPKKLRGDYGASSEADIYVSATPEHESGAPADFIARLNICTIGASERLVISSDSSYHSSTHASEAEGDSIIRSDVVPSMMTEAVVTSHAVDIPPVPKMGVKVTSPVRASLFQDSDSTKIVKADTAGPSYSVWKDLSMGSRELNSETLHQIFVSQWNLLNDSLLDEYDVSREFVDHLAPLTFEHKRLESECEKQAELLKLRDAKIESLKARFPLKETKAVKAVHLRARVSAFEVTKKKHANEIDALKQKNVALENEKGSLDEKVIELQSLVSTKDLELKELNAVVSSLRSQKDGLVSQAHELEVTCFGLRERLPGYENLMDRLEEFRCSAKRASISRSIKKGMQDGLAVGINHGREGRSLIDVAAYNPFAEANFNSALQELRELDYRLLAKLKSHKDASVEDIMNLLRLEGPLADAPGMGDLQHDIEQLKIRENIMVVRFDLLDVWTPLSEPMSIQNLIGEASTSASVPAATTTTLSSTFASASSIPPITVDDYEIVHADGQESPQGNVQGDVATVEFKKEDLDTTLEHDLLS
uniref:Transposase (Putative), gypsy type n=1 Tax=Tanacetum cinerariifolium TaxID=118510 RepID=A0A6L2L9X9_TANCI|nr:hypothetical protein [Tanacetum cinerariifolium]